MADQLQAFIPVLLSRVHIEALIHGNLSRQVHSLLIILTASTEWASPVSVVNLSVYVVCASHWYRML